MDFDSPFAESLANAADLSMEAWAMTTGASSTSTILGTASSNEDNQQKRDKKPKSKPRSSSSSTPTVPESARIIPPDEPVEICDICQRVFKGAKRSTHKQQHTRRLHPQFYVPKRGGKKRSNVGPSDGPIPASKDTPTSTSKSSSAPATAATTIATETAPKVTKSTPASTTSAASPSTQKRSSSVSALETSSSSSSSSSSASSNVNSDGFISVDEASDYLQKMTSFHNMKHQTTTTTTTTTANSTNSKTATPPTPKESKSPESSPAPKEYTQTELDIMALKHGVGPQFDVDEKQEQLLRLIYSVDKKGTVEEYFRQELSPIMQFALTCSNISVSMMKIAIQGAIHYLTTLKAPVNEQAFWEKFLIPEGDYDQDLDDRLAAAFNEDIEAMCMMVEARQPRKKWTPLVTKPDGNSTNNKHQTTMVTFVVSEDRPWERYE